MTIFIVTCVHDAKVGAYLSPTFARTRGEAIRAFSDACQDQNSHLARHAEDFTLFVMGGFDDQKGILIPDSTPMPLCKALDFKTQE